MLQADHLNERAITHAVAAAVEVDIPDNLIVENARRRFEEQLANLAEKVPAGALYCSQLLATSKQCHLKLVPSILAGSHWLALSFFTYP